MEGREARALMKNKIEKRCNYFVFWFAKTLVFLPEISFSLLFLLQRQLLRAETVRLRAQFWCGSEKIEIGKS